MCIAIIGPVRLLRDGLTAMLRGNDFVAALHPMALDDLGFAEIEQVGADIILVDLGGGDAAAIAHRLKSSCPHAKLIAVALAEVDEEIFACAAAGFAAYVSRDADVGELHRTMVDALRGRTRIAATLFSRLAERLDRRRETLPLLTRRENEILALARQGHSNKHIARDLAISPATVKNHIHSILRKLQVSGRREAAQATAATRQPDVAP
jgi:DNA-binding NarL/FixJ family response regulator